MNYRPKVIRKAVGAAGTRERLTTAEILTPYVAIQAIQGNAGNVFVGDDQVSSTNGFELSTLASSTGGSHREASIIFDAGSFGRPGDLINLREIWLDCSTGSQSVTALFLDEEKK